MKDDLDFFEAAEKRVAEDSLEDQRKKISQDVQEEAAHKARQDRQAQEQSERDARPDDQGRQEVLRGGASGGLIASGRTGRESRRWQGGF